MMKHFRLELKGRTNGRSDTEAFIMATISKDLSVKYSTLAFGTPNIEFFYPADVPVNYVRIYHGINNNVPNRRIRKTIKMGESAGGVYSFRDVGYEDELIKLDIVLATKIEAQRFTNFFKNIVKGSANVFYYRNNFTGQESIVRLMENILPMGEGEGHPYSFSLLMRKEAPYSGRSLTVVYSVLPAVFVPAIFIGGHSGYFSMALLPTSSMTLHAVGDNFGQLGLGHYNEIHSFQQVGAETDWVIGAGGESHAHMINDGGELFSAGTNGFGCLGLGTGDSTPENTFIKLGSDTWSKVTAGYRVSAGIKTDGTLWAWGRNTGGQLGQGSYDSSSHNVPLQVGSATDWADVRFGQDVMIAKNSVGELWGCGYNNKGQMGQGSTYLRQTTLIQIGSDTDWDFFDIGWQHVVAVKTNGDLYAWGANSRGELGDGTTTERHTPVKIGSDTWKAIAAGTGGPGRTYGIKVAGTLWSWGMNNNYELGIGSQDSNPHSNPILIGATTDWQSVFAGASHGLAAKIDNELWSWGRNSYGECGVGDVNPVPVPIRTYLVGKSLTVVYDVEVG